MDVAHPWGRGDPPPLAPSVEQEARRGTGSGTRVHSGVGGTSGPRRHVPIHPTGSTWTGRGRHRSGRSLVMEGLDVVDADLDLLRRCGLPVRHAKPKLGELKLLKSTSPMRVYRGQVHPRHEGEGPSRIFTSVRTDRPSPPVRGTSGSGVRPSPVPLTGLRGTGGSGPSTGPTWTGGDWKRPSRRLCSWPPGTHTRPPRDTLSSRPAGGRG